MDAGRILVERRFPIAPGDTALTLNTDCFEEGVAGFADLLAMLAAGQLDFAQGAADVVLRMVRALDHSGYWNPMALPKIAAPDGRVLAVATAEAAAGAGAPGQVLMADETGLTVACGTGAVVLRGLRGMDGGAVCPKTVAKAGDRLPLLDAAAADRIDAAIAAVVRGEPP